MRWSLLLANVYLSLTIDRLSVLKCDKRTFNYNLWVPGSSLMMTGTVWRRHRTTTGR